ncbi:MAG: TnsD family Tn7-like transposition protein [Lacunisphaera sp.]|nr:TnsD family Tn7-like transposition protein [Lacunisphaera sp.]
MLWSIPGRILERYPSLGPRGLRDLFGGTGFPSSKTFPCRLSAIAKILIGQNSQSGRDLAYHHTLFPFTSPLMSAAASSRLLASMLDYRSAIPGPRSSGRDEFLRLCPDCVEEDAQTYGTNYWHRLHQLPHLKICHKHKRPLYRSRVSITEKKTFITAGKALEEATPLTHQSNNIQTLLAAGYESLAAQGEHLSDRSHLFQVVAEKLKEASALDGPHGGHQNVADKLVSMFGLGALEDVGCSAKDDFHGCLRAIIFDHETKKHRGVVALHHVFLLCALTKHPFTEILARANECRPSLGPWKCVSVGVPCSGKHQITTIRKGTWGGIRAARFTCPDCGTVYIRPLPLMEDTDGSFRFEIKKSLLPPAWTVRISELWGDPNQTWGSLCKAIGRSRSEICYHAANLGLPDMPARSLASRRRMIGKERHWKTERDDKRKQWDLLVAQNPSAMKSDLRGLNQYLYGWMEKFDPSYVRVKARAPFSAKLKSAYSSIEAWDSRCAELVTRNGVSARARLLQSHQRISARGLLKIIDPDTTFSTRGRQKLLLLDRALNTLTESPDQHFERLFEAMVRNIQNGNRPATLRPMLRDNHLNKYYDRRSDYAERIRAVYYGALGASSKAAA